jgi:asparagine synthase (glutamine-hydrolysing)
MCGIVGEAYRKGQCSPERLRVMRDSMTHRGPDDAGEWYSSDFRVGLAHRRLSIIDLTQGGHQPMVDSSKQFVIIFNGEIYNYQELRCELRAKGHNFHTESDTEVVLEAYRAWDTDCLNHFNGMFVFCIYDIKKQHFFIARDRAGEKPLFYTEKFGNFAFASELKALMRHPALSRTVSLSALESYFAYGYIPGGDCILKGVHKLPPAHALSFDLSTSELKVWRYWEFPQPQIKQNTDIVDLSNKLELLLKDSVRKQLVADVPVGILLSGGVDSSLIVAMAARVSYKPVKTFTVTFPGHAFYNESSYAKIVAEYFGTQHTELIAEPVSADLLIELVRQYDEPICDSSMIPTFLVSKLIRQHAKVALGGDGGDELFGGYFSYNWIFKQEFARKYVPAYPRQMVSWLVQRFIPHGIRGRNFLLGLYSDLPQACSQMNILFDRNLRSKLIVSLGKKLKGKLGSPELQKVKLCSPAYGLPGMVMALDFMTYLPEDILVKVDRASMLNSLEIRSPMLDYKIVEFAFSQVPNVLRANSMERKILLKHFAKRVLPPQLDLNRKQGFSIPLKSWLKVGFGKFVKEVLNDIDSSVFNQSEIRKLLRNQDRGFLNTERIFALTIFELWRREYKITIDSK